MKRGRRSLLWGFVGSFVLAVLIFVFFPHGKLSDIYLAIGRSPLFLFRISLLLSALLPGIFMNAPFFPGHCIRVTEVLAVFVTWGFFFSNVIYACFPLFGSVYGRLRSDQPVVDETPKQRKRPKCVLVPLAGLFWIIIFLGGFLRFEYYDAPFYGRTFDRARWIDNTSSRGGMENPRGKMAKDLKGRLMREKLTKSEVLALLGQQVGIYRPDGQNPDFLSYHLGSRSEKIWDYYWLDIHFDEDDRVSRVCFRKVKLRLK